MDKKQAQEIAVKLFTIHTGLDNVYITTDGQGFRESANAEAHAQTLKDDKVFDFDRNTMPTEEPEPKTDKEREALVEEYVALFGKQPAHNIGTETLRKKIADEKARLDAKDTTDTGAEGTTDNSTEVAEQTTTAETVEE